MMGIEEESTEKTKNSNMHSVTPRFTKKFKNPEGSPPSSKIALKSRKHNTTREIQVQIAENIEENYRCKLVHDSNIQNINKQSCSKRLKTEKKLSKPIVTDDTMILNNTTLNSTRTPVNHTGTFVGKRHTIVNNELGLEMEGQGSLEQLGTPSNQSLTVTDEKNPMRRSRKLRTKIRERPGDNTKIQNTHDINYEERIYFPNEEVEPIPFYLSHDLSLSKQMQEISQLNIEHNTELIQELSDLKSKLKKVFTVMLENKRRRITK